MPQPSQPDDASALELLSLRQRIDALAIRVEALRKMAQSPQPREWTRAMAHPVDQCVQLLDKAASVHQPRTPEL